MKKLLVVSLALLMMVSAFNVGAQANKASTKPVKVAVVFFDFSNTYLSYMRGVMKAF